MIVRLGSLSDARLVKTYTPVFRGMEGTMELDVKIALYDIVKNIGNEKGIFLVADEIKSFVEMYIKLTEIAHWVDGDYEIFPGYTLKIKKLDKHIVENLQELGY